MCSSLLQNQCKAADVFHMRQTGIWNPLLESLQLDKCLLQQQNANKLQGSKNDYTHAVMAIEQKVQNPTASSEAPGTKARYCEWSLHRAPQRGARRPPRPWLTFTSPPPASGRGQGTCYLSFSTDAAALVPVKPRLSSSSGHLSISIDKRVKKKVRLPIHKNVRWQVH